MVIVDGKSKYSGYIEIEENTFNDIGKYLKALQKNEKAFIKLILKQQRSLKEKQKYIDVCNAIMTRKEKRKVQKLLYKGSDAK